MDETKVSRFHMLDTLRGVMILGVVLFHFAFDMYMFGSELAYKAVTSPVFNIIATIGRILFVLLAGICTRLSRSNLRRGILVLMGADIISFVTLAIDLVFFRSVGELFIYFGILHLMAACILLYALFDFIFKKIKLSRRTMHILSIVLFFVFVLAFAATYNIYEGTLGFGSYSIRIASQLHGTLMGSILGFGGYTPVSADYFPLMPWCFIFFAGSFLGIFFKEDKVPAFLHKDICPPITFIGRKTLWVYLLHQPLIYGIAFCVSNIIP